MSAMLTALRRAWQLRQITLPRYLFRSALINFLWIMPDWCLCSYYSSVCLGDSASYFRSQLKWDITKASSRFATFADLLALCFPDFILLNYSLHLFHADLWIIRLLELGYRVACSLLSSWRRTRCSFHYFDAFSNYCFRYCSEYFP